MRHCNPKRIYRLIPAKTFETYTMKCFFLKYGRKILRMYRMDKYFEKITSMWLAHTLEPIMGYRLSYTIKENINRYYKIFRIVNDKKNKGDITPFIFTYLDFLKESSITLKEKLEGKANALKYYSKSLEALPYGNDDKYRTLYFHLLQAALREVLGDHVHQAGSFQDAEITHFDFTHFSAVTPEELIRVQKIVNDKIFESMNVTVKEMPIEEAKKLGAMALFGEKYGKVVRVVDIEGWSTEFCGGTHVKNTAQIGGFKIVSESSVAAGIRRIEAVTGRNLLNRANMQEAMLHTEANTLKANNVAALPVRAEAVMAENKAMSKELEDIKAKVAASKVTSLFDNAETVGDVKIASAYFTGTSGDTLRGMCDTIRDYAKAAAVAVLVGKSDDKITMAVTVTKDAQAKGLKAGNLVKEISAIAGGKGGGKPDFAMAGLKDETKIDEALAAVSAIVKKALG